MGCIKKQKRTWKQEEAVLGVDLGEKEEELGVNMSKVVVVSHMKLLKYKYILYKRKREKSLIEFGLVKFHKIL